GSSVSSFQRLAYECIFRPLAVPDSAACPLLDLASQGLLPGRSSQRSNEYGSRRLRSHASGIWENYVHAATPVPQELAQTSSLSGIGVPGLYFPQVMPFLCELLPSAASIR